MTTDELSSLVMPRNRFQTLYSMFVAFNWIKNIQHKYNNPNDAFNEYQKNVSFFSHFVNEMKEISNKRRNEWKTEMKNWNKYFVFLYSKWCVMCEN
jgi:hypothetical protein